MTVSEAADALGISHRAVLSRIKNGTLRAVKVNPRLWLIPRAEVEAWREFGKARPWELRNARESGIEVQNDPPAGEP